DPLRAFATQQLQACERMLALDEKLSAIDKGAAQPADASERLRLAELCRRYRQRYVAAARLYAHALAAEPKLADDLDAGHRYNAACQAALAADGQGKGAKPTASDRRALRRQALTWLRAELALRTRQLAGGRPADRAAVQQLLAHWQQ